MKIVKHNKVYFDFIRLEIGHRYIIINFYDLIVNSHKNCFLPSKKTFKCICKVYDKIRIINIKILHVSYSKREKDEETLRERGGGKRRELGIRR